MKLLGAASLLCLAWWQVKALTRAVSASIEIESAAVAQDGSHAVEYPTWEFEGKEGVGLTLCDAKWRCEDGRFAATSEIRVFLPFAPLLPGPEWREAREVARAVRRHEGLHVSICLDSLQALEELAAEAGRCPEEEALRGVLLDSNRRHAELDSSPTVTIDGDWSD